MYTHINEQGRRQQVACMSSHCFWWPSISKIADAATLCHCHELKVSDALYRIICYSGQSSGLFPESLMPTQSCFSFVLQFNHGMLQDCLRVCMLCKAGRVRGNVSFMFLHNVLQCSTHGRCYLHIGGLIIMSVRQIVLSAVQGIILFPSGEGGSSSADACLVFWLLNQRV